MYIVHVHVRVKDEYIKAFKDATLENAKNSVQEPGIARFDVIQEMENPSKFVLVEVYRKFEDSAKHKETAHYIRWRDIVAEMMAEPRKGIQYQNLFPEDSDW